MRRILLLFQFENEKVGELENEFIRPYAMDSLTILNQ